MSDATPLTIEQLAAEADMSVRNIRAHHSRGLLPAPEVRGRTGFYGPEHVARLRLIRDMQADGFNLAAIAHLVARPGRVGEELLGFKRALTAPFESEEPEILGREELVARFPGEGGEADLELLEKAIRLGLVHAVDEDHFEIPSPRLLQAGEQVVALGVPLKVALDLVEELMKPAGEISRRFTRLYLEAVWQPFERAGLPEEGWPEIREALERLRPLASEVLLAVFEPTMTQAVERAFGREAEKLRKRSGPSRKGR